MRKSVFKLAAACVALGSISVAAPAFAQEEEAEGPVSVDVTLAVVSDYRFRGVSLSDKDIAVQPGITVSHESGIYVGAWASNIAENAGSDLELDIFAGFAGGDAASIVPKAEPAPVGWGEMPTSPSTSSISRKNLRSIHRWC